MKNLSGSFIVMGCFLLVIAVVSKFVFPILRDALSMRAIGFVILANTSFLLAILLKK